MSNDADELARLQQAFAGAPPSEIPRSDCPPAGRIWKGVRGELTPAKFREVLHHVASCTVCTEAWRLAEKLEEGSEDGLEESPEETPSPPGSWRFNRVWSSGGAAVAAASILLVIGFYSRDGGNNAPVLREGPRSTAPLSVPEGGEIELLDKGPFQRETVLLRWRVVEDGEHVFDLRLYSAEDPLIPLVKVTGLEATEYSVPPAVLVGLSPQTILRVVLEARHPIEGEHIGVFDIVVR